MNSCALCPRLPVPGSRICASCDADRLMHAKGAGLDQALPEQLWITKILHMRAFQAGQASTFPNVRATAWHPSKEHPTMPLRARLILAVARFWRTLRGLE